jgi:hypothetical protein
MNVDGGASGHLPSLPDGHDPTQDCVGQLRECEPKAIMTHIHHLNPGWSNPDHLGNGVTISSTNEIQTPSENRGER